MFGNNPIRGLEKGPSTILQVQSIFATFQGEGPFSGYPSVFLRLGGCNLACSFCDTEFESFKALELSEILKQIELLSLDQSQKNRMRNLVVITGGEPMRQPIELICYMLLDMGFMVQIETNGTIFRILHPSVDIVCSPKNTGRGYGKIREDLAERITAYKFIISKSNPLYDHVPDVGQNKYNTPVYLQPMDEYDPDKNSENIKYVVELADKTGARIGLQTHKYLGIE
jgi:7-carboxy-7-deazaguanine synthase